jgi:hypothetical protein
MNDTQKLSGLDKVFAAVDSVTSKAPQHGPFAGRRPGRSVLAPAFLWMVLFFVARFALELNGLPTAVRVGIALLPLPAFAWFLWAFIRLVRDSDELERLIQLEALAVAFPLTTLLIMTLGLLQIAVPLSPDDWSYRHIWPFLYVFYIFGIMRARRRYQ